MRCIEEIRFQSSNKQDVIAAKAWLPSQRPVRGVVQIVHSLREYSDRYCELADFLTAQGFVVCSHDWLGHGNTAPGSEHLGDFGPANGLSFLVKDTHKMLRLMYQSYGPAPYFLLGHGAGASLVRLLLSRFEEPLTGCILSAPSGFHPGYAVSQRRAELTIKKQSSSYRSEEFTVPFISGTIKNKEAAPEPQWMNRNTEEIGLLQENPLANFTLTASAVRDMYALLSASSQKEWTYNLAPHLRFLLLSGDHDPVGRYGKAAREIFVQLSRAGVQHITNLSYHEARHDLFHETNKAEVFNDLLIWLCQHCDCGTLRPALPPPALPK